MSWREHWDVVRSSTNPGDVISGCRDNDTHTYRLFCNKGWQDVHLTSTGIENVKLEDAVGRGIAHQLESCECVDLSLEDMQALVAVLNKAIAGHKPWPDFD